MKNIFKIGLVLLVAALVPQVTESIAVMSVDLGSEFMKIAIVKPGVPMEIVLNKESRRKTPLAVSLRSNEREFGENAISQGIKSPKSAYLFITQLLGKSIDNPAVKAYREKYPYYDIKQDEATNTIYFQHDESTRYTPEELLAMILEYARDLAADFSEQSIDAAVLTVPAYFNQAERKAVLRAAEIANLKVLQLINSNVAAGLNYGVFRRKDFNSTGTTVMFFDMGSTGTTATIATFQSVKLKDDFEQNPQLTVRGVGFDRNLGGNAFSLRLAKHLGKLFQEKSKKDVFSSPKATLKIYKEADRVKNILSANTETMSQVEGLMDDVDFKAKVTREEFEKMCADLFDRIKKPIEDAIKMAELPADEIISVILVGGSTRIPKVQDELLKATNKNELGKNLNTDEAPALGAVYQAAYQSKGYKVKKFYIRDANVYQIVVDFERFYAEGEEKDPSLSSTIRRVLFDVLNTYPQKKVMTFSRHTHDFNFVLNYGDLKFLREESLKIMGIQNISLFELKEVASVFEKHKNEETKGIKVHFKMDDSGIVELDKIDIAFEKEVKEEESTLQKLGNTISNFFGGGSGDEKPATEEKPAEGEGEKSEKQQQSSNPDQTANNTTEQATNTTTQSGANTVKPANQTSNVTLVREQIKFERVDLDYKPITRGEIDDSRAKLKVIKEKEKEKRKRASAINSLETFIFDIRDKLTQDEFIKVSKEDERQKISAKVEEIDAWLSETDQSVETQEFNNRLTELKNVCRDPLFRLNEKNYRPRRLDELKDVINKSVEFLGNVKNLTGEDKPLTEVEWNTLEKLITSVKEWRIKMMNEQAKLPENEDPKLLSNDISDKMEELKREVNYLVSKIKYFRPKTTKKPPTAEKSNSTSNSTSSDDGQQQQEQPQTDDKNDESKDNNNGDEKTDQKNSNYDEDIFDKPPTESQTDEEKTSTTNNPEL